MTDPCCKDEGGRVSRGFEECACAHSSRRTPDAMQRDGPGSLTKDDLDLTSALRGSSFHVHPSYLLCAIVLLVLQALWLETSHSQQPGGPEFDKESSRQEGIYQSQGEKVPAGYVIDRSFLAYASILSSEFDRSLAILGPKDRWLDIGAGEGQAILDYYTERYDSMHPEGRERRGKKARAVAISIEDRRTPRWHKTATSLEANQIQYFFGKRLREYSLEELGQFQLISDVIGGFSYSRYLSLFMEKALGVLELNGRFYTLLLDVLPENTTNRASYPDTLFLTEIENADGSDARVCSWLKSIACVEVTCESRTEANRPIEIYRIHKVCNGVTVPALVLIHYEAGTPPQRRFQLRNPTPAPPARTSTNGDRRH